MMSADRMALIPFWPNSNGGEMWEKTTREWSQSKVFLVHTYYSGKNAVPPTVD